MTHAIEVRNVYREFQQRSGMAAAHRPVRAVDGVTFSLPAGDVLGVVGESGCGKSTLARLIMGLLPPTSGEILVDGRSLIGMDRRERARLIQPVFQDPYSSLNPRQRIRDIVGLPLASQGNLPKAQQVSALDVSVQAQILNLLAELRRELGLTYLFISHNLAVVEYIATEVAVMYLGRIVEQAPAQELFGTPTHPYTQALLASVLTPDPALGIPDVGLGDAYPTNIPPGCRFHPRCPSALAKCAATMPDNIRKDGRLVECLLAIPS